MILALVAVLIAAPPLKPTASVEGVTEYRLPNGLKVLLVPDESVATFTMNLTVLVGSRHEGYGEKGMAHLLEHLLFKGSPKFKDPKKEMGARGADWNGTTREDRTNYFETMNASDTNVDFAIRFEADRLVNAFVAKKDLDTEMTVVRNEFEAGENNGSRVLRKAVRSAAFPWHNYGRAVIGIKADIELVPIENLQGFYKRYYQPDNAVVVLAGRFDQTKALAAIVDSFGKIPKPARKLPTTFTTEPTQDGERSVMVRRVGGSPGVLSAWRVPASSDPDAAALMVLQGVLGDEPQGRLHAALVEGKKASSARCDLDDLREPGLFTCHAGFKQGDATAPAREALLALIETPKPVTQAELDRSVTGWVSQLEQVLMNSKEVGLYLSEWAAAGDWRLFFVQRDRMKQVTVGDLERVWAKYLKPQNRTLGEYVPTPKPDRADIPATPDVGPLVEKYVGGAPIARGEAFDSSPKNIEARSRKVTLANGAKLVLLPKKTRAETVRVSMRFPYGSLTSLTNQSTVAAVTVQLMNRGTKKLAYSDFRSTLEKLRAQVTVSLGSQQLQVDVETRRNELPEVLALVNDVLKTPALDAKELEVFRNARLTAIDQQKVEPTALGPLELERALKPYPRGHPFWIATYDERAALLKAVTVEQVRAFHAKFFGAQNGSIAVVGDFDDQQVEKTLTEMFATWTTKEAFVRVPVTHPEGGVQTLTLKTPDKANAWFGNGIIVPIGDESPDYPAMSLATSMMGASPSARLFVSLREKKGLSYGAYMFLDVDSGDPEGILQSTVIAAPQNIAAVETGVEEELTRWSTISKDDLTAARSELLNQLTQARTDDAHLSRILSLRTIEGRTLAWDEKFEKDLGALTPEQLSTVVKKYVDPKKFVTVKAGDFKTVTPPQ